MQVSIEWSLESLTKKNTELTASLSKARRSSDRLGTIAFRSAFVAIVLVLCGFMPHAAHAQTFGCTPAMANDIVCENSKTGNASTEWDVSGAGDLTIQGFATDISVNQGGTVYFKINTDAKLYTIDIYRIGYYLGRGARWIKSVTPSATLPQTQPPCSQNSTTNSVDCGTWAVSASWNVPANATSGVYIAHLVRSDTGGDSHIVFIVRNDSSHSDVLFQTSDESWQAYNNYGAGGFSLYGDNGGFDIPNRALQVSYNRPVLTRGFDSEAATWLFSSEFAMIQWMEQNGYDVTYTTGVDAARNGALIKNHKIYTSTGHDEYWSGPHRTNVEAARDAGVNLAFFSGNEVFWKTRWTNSFDGSNTPYRTLVCYKETIDSKKSDPTSTWTGTWRDPRFSPPSDGGRPENSLTGTLFLVNGVTQGENDGTEFIKVPAADGKMRFWRNTAIASLAAGQTYNLPTSTLGYEWDVDADNGSRPAGAFQLSTTTYSLTVNYLLDYGATYGAGTATHHLMMYRAPSGALVFGAGTVGWAWGLNSNHDDPFGGGVIPNPDVNMQQATVNLFADMGVQPATLQGGLTLATASTDHTAPVSSISSPANGATITGGSSTTISGTASDSGGGVVGGVEVSVDGGTTWHPAIGRSSWTYTWTPTTLGSTTIKTRAVDDSGNIETPSAGISVTVAAHDCPCEAWGSSSTPTLLDSGDGGSIEVGVKFRADYNGYISGIRFYKTSSNTGTHVGNLWSSTGSLLATATFTGETTSGWQQVNFSTPVAITANTTYVASYFAPVGHYSADSTFFATKGVDNPPIHLLQAGVDGPNGLYTYSSVSAFPSSSFNSSNYWVDVVYMPSQSMPGAPPAILLNPSTLSFTASIGLANPPAQSVTLINEGTGTLNWTASSSASWLSVSPSSGAAPNTLSVSVNSTSLAAGNYSGTITVTSSGANNSPQTITVSLVVTNILLSSTFSDGTLSGWAVSPLGNASDWSVANQTASFNGGAPTQIYAGNSSWTDYTLSASFKLSNLSNYPGGIRGRVNPSTGASYVAWLYPAQGLVRLFKNTTWSIDSGTVTQLGVGSAVFDTSNYHTLQLAFSGTQIQVLYDRKVVITATDTANTAGMVALDVYNQPISFQNILVTSNSTNSGTFALSSTSLSYSAAYQGASPSPQTVQLTSTGGTLAWTASSNASWLSVSPTNGVTPASLQVSVNSTTLGGGTFTGAIQVVSLGAVTTTKTINVTLTVTTPPPSLVVSPGSLSFVATAQTAPSAQTISVLNGGYGSFSWTASTDSSWLSASPTSGLTPGSFSVSVSATGMATGNYTGHIVVTASGVAGSPISIPVALQVLSQDMNETFTDLGTGWIISPMGGGGGWTVSNGVYKYNGGGLSQSCAGNSAWTDYSFDANIQLASLSNWPGGVRARVNPSTGAGYAVWLYPGSGLAILYKVGQWNINGSSLTQLAQSVLTYDTAVHDLTVGFNGTLITVSWDGRQLMAVNDSTYASGYVCLDADSQPISYSNVRVAAAQAQAHLDTPSPSSITFGALPGNQPPPQTLNITAGGASTTWAASVSSGASWLSISDSTTLTPGTLTVTANSSGLAEGVYNATITLSAPGASNSPISIPVTFAVKTAILSVTPSTMNFFGASNLNPTPRTFQVSNLGTGTLAWSGTVTSNWLGLSAASGSAPSVVTITPNTSTLANGSYSDTVTVSSPDANNSPATISVATQVGTLLFSDNFSSGAGNWTVGPLGFNSGWSVVNGAYTYNGSGHTQSWAGSSTWTDYTVATNFQLSSTADYPGGLRGRVNPTTGASYGAWIYPAEGIIRLFRIGQWNIDSGNALLGSATGLVMNTNVHTLRLSFQGSTIKVYYDEVLVITATDSTYTQGAVALDVSNQPIAFDNVAVISLP